MIKETGLIQGVFNQDKESILRVEKLIFQTALKFLGDKEKAKDLKQDLLLNTLEKIKNQKIKTVAGIERSTFWRCRDQFRKERAKKRAPRLLTLSIEEINVQDSKAVSPGSKKYHESEEDRIKLCYYTYISREIREGIERSLEYIEEFYNSKDKLKQSDLKYHPDNRIWIILLKTKKDMLRILGQKTENLMERYEELLSKKQPDLLNGEKKELEDLKRYAHKFDYLSRINELIRRARLSFSSQYWNPIIRLFLALPFTHEDIYKTIPEMRVEPPRLMYSIWSKVPELRRGVKEINHQKIKLIFSYHKLVTKDTHREFLFKSIRNDLSNYETIRKMRYSNLKFKRFFNRLIKYFHKRSFIDKVSIRKPFQLNLLMLKEGRIEGDSIDDALLRLPESAIPECLWKRKQRLLKKNKDS